MTDSKAVKRFKKLIKNKTKGTEIYVGHGREEINIEKTNLNEFFDKVQKWGNESFQGHVCGIFGCQENPKNQCPICKGSYCYEHIKIHFHIKDKDGSELHDGIVLRDIKEI